MKNIKIHNFGCKLNFSESATIKRGILASGNFKETQSNQQADINIINTCTVTENADNKCLSLVRLLKKQNPASKIVVMGCMAQLRAGYLSGLQEVDWVLGNDEKFKLPTLLKNGFPEHHYTFCKPISEAKHCAGSYSLFDRTRSFLKIQDGCDYNCSFCTIPNARGKSRSVAMDILIEQCNEILAQGFNEIVLTGVNIGDYRWGQGHEKQTFLDLIKALDSINKRFRIRISSIEPNLLSNQIIEFISTSKHFMHHFHIPLQSGSDTILKQMRRRYLKALYKRKVLKIKALMPNACIGADVIVGFPGESDGLFQQTVDFISQIPINYLHIFPYSQRRDTFADTLTNQNTEREKKYRRKILEDLSKRKQMNFYKSQIGQHVEVLLENPKKQNLKHLYGLTENYIKVAVPYNKALINRLTTVELKTYKESLLEAQV